MARIRSVHPGLFTDEAFVSVSPMARLLWIGIWCECDDQGAFEWKPLGLRMRILPGDNADVPALLAELAGADMVRRYEVEGKAYGVVRNFQRFQRPKKPNSQYPIPTEFRTFLGSSGPSSPPVPNEQAAVGNQFPTGGEIPPQMEDGGWRMEDGDNSPPTPPADAEGSALGLPDPCDEAFAIWRDVAGEAGAVKHQTLTDKWRSQLRQRLKREFKGDLGRWRRYCEAIASTPFLVGRGEKPWRAHLEWALKPESIEKVRVGAYDGMARRG